MATDKTIDRASALFTTSREIDWQERLELVLSIVKELSSIADPRELVNTFTERVGNVIPRDHTLTLSRREVSPPKFRITRYSRWENPVDPWDHPHDVPVLEGGIFGELVFGNTPRIIDDLVVGDDDPAREYLEGIHSLAAIPTYDHGESLNMMIMLSEKPHGFDPDILPEVVWTANLFGRTVHNLRVGEALQRAYDTIDREVETVSDIQNSLLPQSLPEVPGTHWAAHYVTAHRAGGDYYDFLKLDNGSWGVLVADASGHGPGAAVLMAVTHSLAHAYVHEAHDPAAFLERLNHTLFRYYTNQSRAFVTAFYGVYNPADRTLSYANAGHEPPRVHRRATGKLLAMDNVGSLPLGIAAGEAYGHAVFRFEPGDLLVLYTDGITEARNGHGEFFGTEGLDRILSGPCSTAECVLQDITGQLAAFTAGAPPADDQTLLVADIA